MKDELAIVSLLLWLFFFSLQGYTQEVDIEPISSAITQSEENNQTLSSSGHIHINQTDLKKILDNQPAFGLFKDAYFVTGVPLNKPINKNTQQMLCFRSASTSD